MRKFEARAPAVPRTEKRFLLARNALVAARRRPAAGGVETIESSDLSTKILDQVSRVRSPAARVAALRAARRDKLVGLIEQLIDSY